MNKDIKSHEKAEYSYNINLSKGSWAGNVVDLVNRETL
jgi:hypothetical protein